MSGEKLVMIDLDATLIDRNYEVTDQGIYKAIAETQAAGWIVSLNSDTPLSPLKRWRERFRANGPIIAERGAVIEAPGGTIMSTVDADRVSSARQILTTRLSELGLQPWLGNPVEAISNDLRMKPSANIAVLINDQSQCSLRYHVRAIAADGSLKQDEDAFQYVYSQCKNIQPAYGPDIMIDANPDHSVVILSRKSDTKRQGARTLLASLLPLRVIMIGDSMNDFVGADLAEHYAVANASQDFKQISNYVAEATMTSGVIEILDRLRNT